MPLLTAKANQARRNDQLDELVRRYYVTNDESLFGPLLSEARPILSRFLGSKRIFGQLAEDVVQEALTQTVVRLRKRAFSGKGRFASWVVSICWNCFAYQHRQAKTKAGEPNREEDPFRQLADTVAVDYHLQLDHREAEARAGNLIQTVTEVLLSLAPEERAAIAAHCYKGMTPDEACKHLDITPGQFYTGLRRGMKRLQDWAKQNPQLAPSTDEYSALRRVDTGGLFDDFAAFERAAQTREKKAKAERKRKAILTPQQKATTIEYKRQWRARQKQAALGERDELAMAA